MSLWKNWKGKNIPNILGIQDLILKDKKDNIESIKLFYQLNNLLLSKFIWMMYLH